MKFQDLPKEAQKEILRNKKITGFDYFGFRKQNNGIVETDAFSQPLDDVDTDLGWEAVTEIPN